MKAIMVLNVVCLAWMGLCFGMNWEPWTQVAIIAPNMIGWTFVTLMAG